MLLATLIAVILAVALIIQRRYYSALMRRYRQEAEERNELLANAVESTRDIITITGLDD